MKDGAARSLAEILEAALQHSPLREGLHQQKVLSSWKEIVGEEIARHSEALALKDGILWVRVEGSAWSQELTLLKPQIKKRLEERLGKGTVNDVRFHSGSKPPMG